MATIAYYIGEHRVLIDEEFLPLMQKYRYYVRNTGYVVRKLKREGKKSRGTSLHRDVLNAKVGEHVDHINGDRLDNRLSNLRICTNKENIRNQKKRPNKESKYKGIHIRKDGRSKKYSANIMVDFKKIHLGGFVREQDAARAYDKAAKLYFGEFAKLNFPEPKNEFIDIKEACYQQAVVVSSQYVGVGLLKTAKKRPWTAKIKANGKTVFIKNCETQEEAARAYDKKSWELFKDLSKLNFPEEYGNMM